MTAADVSEFKSRYTVKDDDGDSWLQSIGFLTYAEDNWVISEPSLNQLVDDFYLDNQSVKFSAEFSFLRAEPKEAETSRFKLTRSIESEQFKPIIDFLVSGNEKASQSVLIVDLFPQMLRLD